MFDPKILDDLAKKITDALPPVVKNAKEDVEKQVHSVLQATFTKLDLVTREEFDAQTKVLGRTREKLEALEKQVKNLESK